MRLRYLHLPLCGPLRDVAVVFGQEPMLFGRSDERPAGRVGAINFVVGVNGTGKSSLLRALYRIFRDLKSRRFPPMPVTVAWDWDGGNKPVTAVFHHPGDGSAEPFFTAIDRVCPATRLDGWQDRIRNLIETSGNPMPEREVGQNAVSTSFLDAHLPRRVLDPSASMRDCYHPPASPTSPEAPLPEPFLLNHLRRRREGPWADNTIAHDAPARHAESMIRVQRQATAQSGREAGNRRKDVS